MSEKNMSEKKDATHYSSENPNSSFAKKETITADVAADEVNRWLDYKKVGQARREAYQDAIDEIKDAVSDGTLTLDDDFNLVQKLKFPVAEQTELIHKPRLTDADIEPKMKGVKAGDSKGMIQAYCAALTSLPRSIINKLDTEDLRVSRSIATFFI